MSEPEKPEEDPLAMTTDAAGQPRSRRSPIKRFWPLALLAAGFAAFFLFGLDEYLTYQSLVENRDWLQQQVAEHSVVTFLAYIVIYGAAVAFSLPVGTVMTLAGGFLFGTLVGGSLTVVAATLGSVAVFLAARSAVGGALRAKAGGALDKMEKGFQENALSYLLVLRLIPIFPFFIVNIVPALIGVPLSTYALGTLLGIIPGTFVYASVGAGLGAILDRGETPDLGIIFEPAVLLPLLGLSALALLPVAYRRLKRKDA